MKPPFRSKLLAAAVVAASLAAACGAQAESSPSGEGRLQVMASFYPLAWVAEQVGGDRVVVTDLTPQGGEAHDATLTASERAGLEDADLVLIHGDYGFQPTFEEAVAQNGAPVLALADGGDRQVVFDEESGAPALHLWLDPQVMRSFVTELGARLGDLDPAHRAEYAERAAATDARLREVGTRFQPPCDFDTIVTSHEAYWYLLNGYGFGNDVTPSEQVGVEGMTPEGEPSADRVQAALTAIRSGVSPSAIFYEPTDEGQRVAEAVAADVGAEVVPLNPLESRPADGDYLTALQQDVDTLADWMGCR